MTAITETVAAKPWWRELDLGARPCGLCGANTSRPAGTRRDGLAFAECERCGLAYLQPMPSAESLRRIYQGDYYGESADPAAGIVKGYRHYRASHRDSADPRRLECRLIRRRLRSLREKRVLDVGCASGSLLAAFQKLGADCAGVELNSHQADRARKTLSIPVFETPLEHGLPLADDACDIIVLGSVLEHTASPAAFLDETARLLAPAGLLLVITPNWDCAQTQGADWVGWWGQWEHTCYFSPVTLRAALAERGLHPLAEGSGGPPAARQSQQSRAGSKRLRRSLKSIPWLGPAAVTLKRTLAPARLSPLSTAQSDYIALFQKTAPPR